MSTNYGKQIAKNKGAVVTTFVVAFLATYAVMGNGGWQARSAEMSAAVASQSSTPTITSAVVETGAGGASYLRITGTGFSTTNNLVTVCKVTTASGNCDSKPGTTMYISGVRASTTVASANTIYVALKTKYSSGSAVATSAKHRVFILNNTTKKTSSGVTLVSLVPTVNPTTPIDFLTFTVNPDSPFGQIFCTEGQSANECDKVAIASYDFQATTSDIMIEDITFNISRSPRNGATIEDAYLYEDDIEFDQSSVNLTGNTETIPVTFHQIDFMVPKGIKKTITLKVHIKNAGVSPSIILSQFSGAKIGTAHIGGGGGGWGNRLVVRNMGLVSELRSKSIYTTGVRQVSNSTSTLVATFNIRLKAVGGDIILGTVASRTPAFSSSTGFRIYRNGIQINSTNLSISYPVPLSGVVTTGLNNSFILSEQTEVIIPVTVMLLGRDMSGQPISTPSSYSVGVKNISWFTRSGSYQVNNFEAGAPLWSPLWTTEKVSFP